MKGKIYTPDEVTRMIPLLSRIADDVVMTYRRVQDTLHEIEREHARLGDGDLQQLISLDAESSKRLDALNREMDYVLERFQRQITEVEDLGGVVMDYERGCFDFYGEVNGEIVYLCWKRGEPELGHWHRLDEGFAERHAIPVATSAA